MMTDVLLKSRNLFIERVKARQEKIHEWLKAYEGSKELPLYSSVDIRDAGFKIAIVDTNIFPGGFNNLCEHGLEDAVKFIREALIRRISGNCKNVLLIAEEHTRNTWYLENIRILEEIIRKAGFNVKTATFLSIQPAFCEGTRFVELETATKQSVRIYCLKRILEDFEAGLEQFCLIILNNDLTTGIPEILKNAKQPIYPSIQAGWHSRLKSNHFTHTKNLMAEFAKIVELDPWFFSCPFYAEDHININEEADRKRLAQTAAKLFTEIEKKYKEHDIKEKPYVMVKADAGTYGMGVLPVENPEDIISLNRKDKNKLYKGKSSQTIERYLLQEGVPTIYNIEHEVSEVVIYQIENNLVGGFYRSHAQKSDRENLNTQGADFTKKICPRLSKYGDCGVRADMNIFDVYRILARIAGIAAHREIIQLEAQKK
ncbi:MAG TPA: glutamate--cysteine ligase [Candidatus Omnitrophota bacterium]|nr:glutamate--cysteine ligase [Candidatus Omnitrophota bacterium]